MTGRLAGRTCLVTGATGMAADAARRFAAEGAAVVVIDRDARHCAEVGLPYVVADLTDEAATEAAFARIRRLLPRLDAAYAVAGGSGRRYGDGPAHAVDLAAWRATLGLNLDPAFLTAREAVRWMLDQPRDADGARGSVVVMTSVLATTPAAPFATHAYAAAKAAAVGLVRAMAAAYAADGVRVNALAPGLVRTPMAARAAGDPATVAYARQRQALRGDLLEPDEVTDAALFLVARDSRAVTGQTIAVDGGWQVLDGAEPIPARPDPSEDP